MNIFTITSLNVLYEPTIAEDSPYHFNARWWYIEKHIVKYDVITLQEVHVSYLPTVKAFADNNGYTMINCLYHDIRQTHLVTMTRFQCLSHVIHHAPGSYSRALSVLIQLPRYTDAYGDEHDGERGTIFNVHLPLDIKNTGECLRATEAFTRAAAACKKFVLIGDWNTLPSRAEAQLDIAREVGTLVMCDFPEDAIWSTYWGYPFEKPEFRKFNSPAILDRILTGPGIGIISGECPHLKALIDGNLMAISDHFPVCAKLQFYE